MNETQRFYLHREQKAKQGTDHTRPVSRRLQLHTRTQVVLLQASPCSRGLRPSLGARVPAASTGQGGEPLWGFTSRSAAHGPGIHTASFSALPLVSPVTCPLFPWLALQDRETPLGCFLPTSYA